MTLTHIETLNKLIQYYKNDTPRLINLQQDPK